MKTCSYCGKENLDGAMNCSGCGQADFDAKDVAQVADDWVFLEICQRTPDAEQRIAKLRAAGIEALVPSVEEMEAIGNDFNTSLIEKGGAWIYVHRGDYPAAKKFLPPEEKSEPAPPAATGMGEKQVIACLEASQTGPILERLKTAGIPVEVRSVADESGLEMSELLVAASHYDQGCDLVEAWSEEQTPVKKQPPVCPQCGSQNCNSTPHIRLGWVVQCKECGFEFLS